MSRERVLENRVGQAIRMLTGLCFMMTTPVAAWSQESSEATYQYVLDFGAGAQFKPKYPGADEYLVYPFPIFAVQRFFVPGLGQVADGRSSSRAFYIFPSFDFNGRREPSDANDLTGTSPIDWALEAGLGFGYRYDWLRASAAVRQGFNGHDGQVVELGLDLALSPTERFQFNIGPRLTWGSQDYVETYFGVTPAEASAPGSILTAYDPGSSFTATGIEARTVYALTENTRFHVRAGWERFIGDAAKSPIVAVGSRDHFSIGAGFTYRFSFDLFQ